MNQINSTTRQEKHDRPAYLGSTSYGFGWQDYVYLTICSFGIFTNAINVSVFLQIKQKDIRYKFMLWKSFTNFVYLTVLFVNVFLNNCTNCPSKKLYISVFYLAYMVIYLSSCLALLRILFELLLAFKSYSILIGCNWFAKTAPKVTLTTSIMICLAFYSPRLAAFQISSEPTKTDAYYVSLTRFGQSDEFKVISTVQSLVRTFLNVIVLGLVNFLTLIQFRRWFKVRRVEFALDLVNSTTHLETQKGINYYLIIIFFINFYFK